MAERFVRLYGPASISQDPGTPTSLFTVSNRNLYTIRLLTAVIPAISSTAVDATVLLGLTDLSPENLVAGLTINGSTSGHSTGNLNLATPFIDGETLVGAALNATTPARQDYDASDDLLWSTTTSSDSATYNTTFTPQTMDVPENIYWVVVNTKASSPDTISSIVDNHVNPVTNIGSIVSAAATGVRASIWGGYAGTAPTASSNTYTTTLGGTATAFFAKAIAIKGSALAISATPSTSNIILQTATNTGTTETSQGVTMTPTASDGTYQILVVGTNGSASTYTAPTNGTEFADGANVTPNCTAAAFLIYPATTNPAATIAAAGTDWAAACIEVPVGGALPAITLSGIIIEP